ncbi:MAG: exodeoxyribonuclease III [Firmicutes bacterium]|nr:exodeoxyribonuclease III [Bacillota bacterium]
MFKVATYNANSVRARLPIIMDWLAAEKPDVLCLQETKVENHNFPAADFNDLGYRVLYKGQKSYNGVAVASVHELTELSIDISAFARPGEARLIAVQVKGVNIINTYIPQGKAPDTDEFAYKLNWLRGMRDVFARDFSPDAYLLWTGDFNVAPEPIDVHSPEKLLGHLGYHPMEHQALQYVKDWGFEDIFRRHVPEGGHYTFFDYRVPNGVKRKMGWRIDHIWTTGPLAALSRAARIDMAPRLKEKPSDHTFLVAEFELD